MSPKFYVAMAPTVAEYVQSDYLYLMKLRDGRIIGFSAEFEYGTTDILEASHGNETSSSISNTPRMANWLGLSDDLVEGWRPATWEEIQARQLEKCLIGWKQDMHPAGTVQPLL
jgi:hypothetical protein